MKKLASLLLALVMIMSCFSAMAATVTNATSGHSYNAYQVFAGTQPEDSSMLGDIVWGTGVNGDALLTQLKADYGYFDACTDAASVAKVLEGKADGCAEAMALANAAAKNLTTTYTEIAKDANSVELAAGYWLLVDTTAVDETSDARNTALLQVTNDGDIQIQKKYTVPSVDKTIDGEGEAADAAIGDTLTFVLTGTLPSNLSDYDTYKVIFHDTMSEGLTFGQIVSVNVGDKTLASTDYTATNAAGTVTINGETKNVTNITITIDDVIEHDATSTSKIVVKYTATVNNKAVIGSAGNPNEVYLEYSNDPNWDGEPTDEPTGNTPKDEVIVFTYQLDVDKVNKDDDGLKDAQFILLSSDKTKIAEVADGKLVKWVALSTVTANTDGTYPAEYTLTSDANGDFSIGGLDAGTYYLRETKAPAGYNKLTEDTKLVIEATITNTEDAQSLDKLTITVVEAKDGETLTPADGNVTTGVVETDVVNNAGSTLPETGGMGTTLLYVGGGILVLAAIVLLIAKRRTSAE